MIDLTSHKLGETDQLIEVAQKEDFQQLLLSMSQQAQHRILIFSHHLEHSLFDNDELFEAIKNLAIKNQRTHIQILLQDAKPMTTKGHRLLKLAQRISSHMTIKIAAKEHHDIFETFIIFDDRGYIIHTHPERYDAVGNFYAPLKTQQLYEQFEELWSRGIIDNSLRRLSL
ncbi:MAG: hypothetical protein KZQ64_07110 [gamma proteobacterium symbiont of Bathyaustriella thionipta]|nr:hypothetical protein [gamma proteobacterium symbiont of Bathyaustriella thionipta]MCU7950777.1 hypothetical protein [gamma proteobacterium symbiont of Bathyaustriella thionipta]MCU7953141.1 hypothetical protein [gamma proteobacterium symbiont of Bathyaustriella thionipta]MCU7957295.1 hypothetical protein [gamma proteobacterium symbiont of Bathyaustriella thionipta]MCU7966177.1 hypothetical protein [gamma proteobacterium symbiont of Bathyaustriella thionipta]